MRRRGEIQLCPDVCSGQGAKTGVASTVRPGDERGGRRIDGLRGALSGWIGQLLNVAPRIIKPFGRTLDVRIYSDACTTGGRLASVPFSADHGGEYPVWLKGAVEGELIGGLNEITGNFGLEMFAMAAAVVALGEHLREKRIALPLETNAAAGASITAASRAPGS